MQIMVSNPTVGQLPQGSVDSVLFGTLLVLTPLQPHTQLMQRSREARAEARKRGKYALLSRSHHFVPVATETSGDLDPDALSCSLILAGVRGHYA